MPTYKLKSVLNGMSPSTYFGGEGQYLAGVGIDPEQLVGSDASKSGGLISPVRYEKFNSTSLTAAPMWLLNSPKNTLTYAYASNGRLLSYTTALTIASEVFIGTATSGAGNGAAYYDNYHYLFTPTDVSRYGPLNGTASLTNNVWTGSTLGTQTALTNTPYPSVQWGSYPNHAPHSHYGKLYFCDFLDGVGYIHFIQTTKTTVEGDTNNGSVYNALALPRGYYPFDIESYGADLIILCSQPSTSTVTKQGKATLFFWDTYSNKPYRQVDLPDTFGTALLTHNGIPHIWSGSYLGGVRLSRYVGGNQMETLEFIPEGTPPPAGCVDALGNRICWGGWSSKPVISLGVYARGYVNPKLPDKALNKIGIFTGTTDALQNGGISALKFIQEGKFQPIMGWSDANTTYGLDKISTTATYNSVFRGEMVNVGQPFQIKKIRMPLSGLASANVSIVPKIYVDEESSSVTLDTITAANDSGRNNAVRYKTINGNHNFFLELTIGGTQNISVGLPIEAEIGLLKD